MGGTLTPDTISTKLQRIATLAKQMPETALRTLAHHIDIEWMREAHRRTRKDGAPGTDGKTAEEYAANLEENLRSLLDRAKSGSYRAPPVRRVHIPKEDGTTRSIGIPTFEDKVLQRAVAMVLEAVYEQDFLSCSYGFRPGRSAHDALQALWTNTTRWGASVWILEVDIQSFFDTLVHARLREIVQQRIGDGVLLRLIGKWLNAGVLENGSITRPDEGTPQGGVISPLLANIYLHEVMDLWFERDVRPRLAGAAFMIRYADDFVIGFTTEQDARRVLAVLPKRFGKYGLTLHPDKTRLVPFQRPGASGPRPGTFDFLGFLHFWGKSRKKRWIVRRKTSPKRFRRALKRVSDWCRGSRHLPIMEQRKQLARKLRGHYSYYGITGNSRSLGRFQYEVIRTWKRWLDRRSQRGRARWSYFVRWLAVFPLPAPVVVHSVFRRTAKP